MVGTPRLVPCCINMRLSPKQPLVKCNHCGAWPMSIVTSEGGLSYGRATFRCAKCRAQEAHTVWRGGAAHARRSGGPLNHAGRIEKFGTRRRNSTALGPSRHQGQAAEIKPAGSRGCPKAGRDGLRRDARRRTCNDLGGSPRSRCCRLVAASQSRLVWDQPHFSCPQAL